MCIERDARVWTSDSVYLVLYWPGTRNYLYFRSLRLYAPEGPRGAWDTA